jgi:hypothetical protein
MQTGTTTLALLVEDLDQAALVSELERFTGATLVYANVDADWIDRMRVALGEATSVTPSAPTAPSDESPPADDAPPAAGG